jgi:hypothetical protein
MILTYKNKEITLIECKSFYKRLKGFMFCKNIDKALLFKHCNSIHTCFMKKNIDVIMCDKSYKVLYYYPNLKKWKFIFPKKNIYLTIETPSNYFDIKIGDIMEVRK